MARGNDEAFTLYGLLAKSVETDDARSYVTFRLDPRRVSRTANRCSPRTCCFPGPCCATRAVPTIASIIPKSQRPRRSTRSRCGSIFGGADDRELPLILGLMPILPRHAVDVATFEETSMTAPVGSGPYRVTAVKPGASVTLTRNPDYWGRDLPVNRGLWNFDEIRLDFYREANGQFEAFKRGLYDFRVETEPLRWHDGYDFPAARNGEVIRDTIKTGMPQPSEFLVFNTRRPVFSDIRVRQALTLLFDFEWINRNYFFGLYARAAGFFAGSELSAYGRPADDRERELLKPFASHIPPDILDGSYRLPVSDGSGRDRATLRSALTLLSQAGYDLDGTVLRQRSTKAPLTFEILVTTRDQERIALAYARDLKRAGIEAIGARGRCRSIRSAPARLRFRHDPEPLGSVVVAGQRAVVLLGQRGRGQPGHAKLHGRQGPRHRRHDRGHAGGARASRLRLGGSGAGPDPDVGLLRYSAV